MAGRRQIHAPRRLWPRLRGVVFTALGVTLAYWAFKFNRADALVGAVCCLLPVLISLVGLAVLPRRARHIRSLPSHLAHAGESMRVTINPGATGKAHAADVIVDATPAGPRVVEQMPDGAWGYEVVLDRRGLWPLGPAIIRHADAFGLVNADDVVSPATVVAVAPRSAVVTLPRLTAEERDAPQRRLSAVKVIDPATVRDYHHGDPRRLVHWRASLRRDRLMVRGDRPLGHADLWLVLDTVAPPGSGLRGARAGKGSEARSKVHGGGAEESGVGAPSMDAGEDALAVACAVAVAAMRAGHRVHIVETGQERFVKASQAASGLVGKASGGGPLRSMSRLLPGPLVRLLPRSLRAARTPSAASQPTGQPAGEAPGDLSVGGARTEGAAHVIEPADRTEGLLRTLAALQFGAADGPGWQAAIAAGAAEAGGPVAVVAVLSHTSPDRLKALAEVGSLASPALAWTPDPDARATLAAAGFSPLEAELPALQAADFDPDGADL